ncbi:p48 polypeptide of DNA primase [Tilletia horrida]|uniref:DNA primase n=1 Tax=Tilletia horrida TaxID=155126 RepID=A0AAN6JTA6_9BASI|nr:p48 polypeptide of DNA primase [Tilletia horrida]
MPAAVAQPSSSLVSADSLSQRSKAASNRPQDSHDEHIDAEVDRFMAQFDEKSMDRDDSGDVNVMRAYYDRLLPWRPLYTWLNRDLPHKPSKNFTHREFAFTITKDTGDEIYVRYKSFDEWEKLKKEVVKDLPIRFEIGPAYNAKPKDRKMLERATFRPVSRELVFDIDMSDYDEIRTCCSGKGICVRCWAFIAVAVKVLDDTLRSDFGFRHLLWVYSGRRGIHCWVSDASACDLADDARKAIVGWLEVVRGSANQAKKVFLGSAAGLHERLLHPSLHRALYGSTDSGRLIGDPHSEPTGVLERTFVKTVLKDQDCFAVKKQWETLLELLPNGSDGNSPIEKLRKEWTANPSRSSVLKWQDVNKARNQANTGFQKVWNAAMEDIVLQYTYPRIDAEVSKHLNHLLKSPFVVHPATGRVCVPVDPKRVDSFDPEKTAPTAAQLRREMHSWTAKKQDGRQGSGVEPKNDWEKTSLKPFVELFEKHCNGIVKQSVSAQRSE